MIITSLALACLAGPTLEPLPLGPEPMGTGDIAWQEGTFFSALGSAGESKKLILLYVWSGESAQCAKLYGETMNEDGVAERMNKYVCYSANTADPAGYKLVERFNVTSLPAILFVQPDGKVEDAVIGWIDPGGFLQELDRIDRGEATVTDLRKKAEEAPSDIDAQFLYAIKLQDCGDKDGYKVVAQRIKDNDPKGKNVVAARLHFEDLSGTIVDSAKSEDGEYEFKGVDLTPMHKHLKKVKHAEILFDGWNWVAAVNREAENRPAAREASMKAYPHAEGEAIAWFGDELVMKFFDERDDLAKNEKKFALDVAKKNAEAAFAKLEKAIADLQAEGGKGCGSYEGCTEGDDEGCGGCGGGKGELARTRARHTDILACAHFMAGKTRKAVNLIEEAIALAPDEKSHGERLALFRK